MALSGTIVERDRAEAGSLPGSTVPRLHSLDSLRGIAACIVLFAHLLLLRPEGLREHTPLWISFTPLRLALNGYTSVILFFVLSGYVLTLPFLRPGPKSYAAYLLKRLCRIYLPFAAAIAFAAVFYMASAAAPSNISNDWLRSLWGDRSISPTVLLRHLAMTGLDRDKWLDPVMWSLVYELRISLIFPLIVMLGGRARRALLIAALLYGEAAAVSLLISSHASLEGATDYAATLLNTLRYTSLFILGSVLARHNGQIRARLHALSRPRWVACFIAALAVFSIPPEIHNQRLLAMVPLLDSGLPKFVLEAATGLAVGFIIVSARNIRRFAAALEFPPIRWLGKVSYSLYLVHLPILFFLVRTLSATTSFYAIAALGLVTSLAAAGLFYELVERPAMHLGRALGNLAVLGRTLPGRVSAAWPNAILARHSALDAIASDPVAPTGDEKAA